MVLVLMIALMAIMQRQLEELRAQRGNVEPASGPRANTPWPPVQASGPSGASGSPAGGSAAGARQRKRDSDRRPEGIPPGAIW